MAVEKPKPCYDCGRPIQGRPRYAKYCKECTDRREREKHTRLHKNWRKNRRVIRVHADMRERLAAKKKELGLRTYGELFEYFLWETRKPLN